MTRRKKKGVRETPGRKLDKEGRKSKVTVTLSEPMIRRLKRLGKDNLSAGIRRVTRAFNKRKKRSE